MEAAGPCAEGWGGRGHRWPARLSRRRLAMNTPFLANLSVLSRIFTFTWGPCSHT